MKIKGLFKEKPAVLKAIIIIYSLATILYFAVAIVALSSKDLIKKIPDFSSISMPDAQASLIIATIFIALSFFCFFIVRGLLKNQKWARIALILFCIFNVIGGVFSILEGDFLSLINLVFNLAVASYLIFSKEIKKYSYSI